MKILGLSRYVPGAPVLTENMASRHGADAKALLKRPGVKTRYYADESQIDMGIKAAVLALEKAGLGIDDIDMVLSASAVPYQPIPSMSTIYLAQLGATEGRVETMDVNTTCLSFLSAFELASTLIEAGRVGRVLIIASEQASRGLPWHKDPECAAHFGDGSAACVLGPGTDTITASRFRTYTQWTSCQLRSGGTRYDYDADREAFERGRFFKMNGPDLFRLTMKHLPAFIDTVLDEAGWSRNDLTCVVPHQASPLAIRHMTRVLGFGCPVIDIAESYGNQIAASIPTTLCIAQEKGMLVPGAKVLVLGTSAGVSFGAVALEMGEDA